MEFFKTKIYGGEVNVIFNGKYYIFISGWYGLCAYAQREGFDESKFKLFVDMNNTRGGDYKDFAQMAKRIINKSENKYIERVVEYEVTHDDLNKRHINVGII